jgi:hypothetical protein
MNIKTLTIALAIGFGNSTGFAQTTPPAIIEDFKPSSLNQPGQEYPQVN